MTWLNFLFDSGLGGILSDEMGLGKTLQSLTAISLRHAKEGGRSLVVAPSTVVGHWVDEAGRYFDGVLRCKAFAGKGRDTKGDWNVLVASYSALRASAREVRAGEERSDEALPTPPPFLTPLPLYRC